MKDKESLFAHVCNVLTADDWAYDQIADSTVKWEFTGDNGEWTVVVDIDEDDVSLVIYSILSFAAPVESRMALSEFIARANYGIIVGNFELDFNDGELRYKTSIVAKHIDLTAAAIHDLLIMNLMVTDTYLPGINAVLSDGTTPEQAIQSVEDRSGRATDGVG